MKPACYSAFLFLLAATAFGETTLNPKAGDGPDPAGPVGGPVRATPAIVPVAKPEKRAKGPTEITAREATFDNRTHEAAFTGDVVVKDPEFGVSCEKMTVYLKKLPEKSSAEQRPKDALESGSGLEKVIAEIDVVISQTKKDANGKLQRYIGRARKAVYDNTTGNVILSGWPQIEENVGGIVSKKITSLEERCVITVNRAGKIDVNGLHKTSLQDNGNLDQGRP